MDKQESQKKLDDITGALKHLIEKTQLKAGLLKLEARDAWEDLEKGLLRVQNLLQKDWEQTKQDMGEASLQMHLGMMEAKEEWSELKEYVESGLKSLKAGEKIDRAVLQAHLAKMEAQDRFAEKRKQWKQHYESQVKPSLNQSMDEMQSEMETMAKSMVD